MSDSPVTWKKMGRIIQPQASLWWMKSHAMLPSPQILSEDYVKIYFSGRDSNNVSHIGWAIAEFIDTPKIVEYSSEPILSPGRRGCFDDNGVTPSCVVENEGKIYLYYIGWNPGFNVRMHLYGGLAISEDEGKTFERYSEAPIIERSRVNPYLNTAPNVIRTDASWLMYYVSGTEWIHKDLPRYNIQIATSKDGLLWTREGAVAINYKNDQEMALARPWVVQDESGLFRMWFSHKGDATEGSSYRAGYAESEDGWRWERNDGLANIDTSPSGWDSEMIEYFSIFTMKEQKYMLFNGNNYGATGVGIAVAE